MDIYSVDGKHKYILNQDLVYKSYFIIKNNNKRK